MEIVLNQKAYFNSIKDVEEFEDRLKEYRDKIIVLPSYIYLKHFVDNGFIVGCQNVSEYLDGPHTGDITVNMLTDIGVKYALIGHSEIRSEEENKKIINKIDISLNSKLNVILCIGESLEEKKNLKTLGVIDKMLDGVPKEVTVSYEPIWSIGSDLIPTDEEIKHIINHIKSKGFKKVFYGGSVNERTISSLKEIEEVDGFLIGSGSVNSESVIKMIEVLSE